MSVCRLTNLLLAINPPPASSPCGAGDLGDQKMFWAEGAVGS